MDQVTTTFSLGSVIGLLLSTSVVTAVINQGLGWLRDARRDRASNLGAARHQAAHLATALEAYAFDCEYSIAELEMWESSRGAAGSLIDDLPELPVLPHADWKALDAGIVSEYLTLFSELRSINRGVSFAQNVMVEGDIYGRDGIMANALGSMGYKALRIAMLARKKYKLPSFKVRGFVIDRLKRNYEAAQTRFRPES
ncbi:hypothetical protein [Chelatococcus sp. XZ-Ab1]|uniref:hypothetical protein n=1 Tax=Chelatococcus sp. XZ-Ab1 TaxID=3034027 RepID=UPI0023E37475|nr:hypothetical protein [Chelatococcus sp. XZ-Ab1]